ncbi:MAG: PQQ-binding-like beta-propeller repeat protein [Alphaproteobacteria bacterium]|nr:PQQ-binding-like beta-propeller repeat protein [Alphaproteobacteria bacterium]
MFSKSKYAWLMSAFLALNACSGKKDTLQGTRVSVLDKPQVSALQKEASKAVLLSEAQNVTTWSQTLSSATHTSKNLLAAQNLSERWSASFGEGADKRNLLLASPVIVDGVVYTQDVEGTVSAFDLKSGEKIFKQKLKPQNENDSSSAMNGSGIAADTKNLYALTGFGSVFALDLKDGNILWRKDLNIPLRTAPTVAGGKLFVQTIDNRLFCLDTSDGAEIWTYSISAEETVLAGGAASAYDSSKQIVVTAFSNGELQAFNAQIGYPLWSNNLVSTGKFIAASPINAVKAAPVIDGNVVYAIGNNNQMLAANLETGDIIWQKQIGGTATPFVDKEAVFFVSNNMDLIALDKSNGNILWQQPLLADMSAKDKAEIYISGPILVNSQLLVATSSGDVLMFDAKTGAQKSDLHIGEPLPFGPIGADKYIVFVSSDAELIVYQ